MISDSWFVVREQSELVRCGGQICNKIPEYKTAKSEFTSQQIGELANLRVCGKKTAMRKRKITNDRKTKQWTVKL